MAESPVKHADAVIRVCFTGHISKGVWVSARIPPGGGFCVIKALHQVSTTNLRGDSMSHSTEVIPQTKPWYKKWWGILIVICIWPYFFIWFVWSKTKWNKLAKAGATAGLIVAALIGVTIMAQGSSTPNQPAPVAKTTSTPKPTPTPSSTPVPKSASKTVDVSQVKASLTQGDKYTKDLFISGQAALGTYQYPDASSGLDALNNDPNSPAAKWSAYNQGFDATYAKASMNSHLSYNDASNAYFNANTTQPSAIDDWSTANDQTYNDISTWKNDATKWQISAISNDQFNSDTQKVQQDFSQSAAIIAKVQ